MAMKFVMGQGWEYEPPSSCCLGGGAGFGSQSQSQSSNTYPTNMQNQAFQNLAWQTATQLGNLGQGNAPAGNIQGFGAYNPWTVNGYSSASRQNPLVAQVTPEQTATLGQIGKLVGETPGNLSSAFGLLNTEANPGFAAGLATSPETQAVERSAIAPISQQFNTQTVPGLGGSFTQAGQRVGSGGGSSAFDTSFANAQGQELATEAATTGAIANNAYQTGLNITANAPGQIAGLNSSEMNTLISGLNAQALPQLTQQYGISAGTQLYQQQMNTILQALGLQVQGEQPALGYTSTSRGSGSGFNASANALF